MTSTAVQVRFEADSSQARTAIESARDAVPAIVLPGRVVVYAKRDTDRVTGRVEFPYEVGGRTSVPIDYRNTGPITQCLNAPMPQCLDAKASSRLGLVTRWRDLCSADPKLSRHILAKAVASQATIRCSVRSLQLWAQKLDTLGAASLSDNYAAAPRKLLALDAPSASDAVSVCAWWAFRIGNVETIDATMMFHAHQTRGRAPCLADVLAAIDCYYSWDTDRARYPFKVFARWAKYDFETWLGRSRDKDDYRQGKAQERVELQGGDVSDHQFSGVPDARTRKRDTRDRSTRSQIEALRSEPRVEATGCSEPHASASGAVPINNPASSLRRSVASSLPTSSVHEAILSLDDRLRMMLFSAARNDVTAQAQAVSTMPLWWDKMPESVRNNIAVRSECWMRAHKGASDRAVRAVQLTMLIAELKRDRRKFARSTVTVGGAL